MTRSFTLILASLCLLTTASRLDAGVIFSNVSATSSSGTTYANAAHGYIAGNDAQSGGNPLLRYLNSGTNAGEILTLQPGNKAFRISSTGMFSTTLDSFAGTGTPVVDLISYQASNFDARDGGSWTFEGKVDGSENSSNLLSSVALGQKIGEIEITGDLSGSIALSLKAGNTFSVYLFQDMSGISKFNFDLTDAGGALSHATLYTGGPTGGGGGGSGGGGGGTGTVPEPASFGVLLGVAGFRRRRNTVAKNK
ncbi:hypothetical protein SH139x_000218 [Planctomycetaceae bacterium SH139]